MKACRQALMVCAGILVGYGLLVLLSATRPFGLRFFMKQAVWLLVALGGFGVCARVHLLRLQRYACWIGLGTGLLLVSVLVPGVSHAIKGTHRWIVFHGIRLQPSELAKVGFVLFFADFLARCMQDQAHFLKGFVRPIAVVGVFCCLLMAEPDFGTTALFGTVAAVLLWIRGIRLRFILPGLCLAVALFSIIIYHNPLRLKRILAFLDLENNRMGTGYQLWQSLIAFTSGGWFGCGLGKGSQAFFFLPEAHTDFIGAILAEELGVVQFFVVLACFACIALCGLRIVRQQSHPFLFFTGVLPTKGIALPFLSYGGSSLLSSFCLLGLMVNVSRERYSPLQQLQCLSSACESEMDAS